MLKLLFAFVLILTFSTDSICAYDYFSDNFDNNDLSKWEPCSNGNCSSWTVENGRLIGSVSGGDSSVMYSKWDYNNYLGDYSIEADVINVSGVDQVFFARVSQDRSKYYQIGYRYNESAYGSTDKNNISLFKYDNGYVFADLYPSTATPRSFDLLQNTLHHIRVELSGPSIKVFFDNILAIDYTDVDLPILNGGVGVLNWSGDCPGIVKNIFDNFLVTSIGVYPPVFTPTLTPTPTLTLTPTPTTIPAKKSKIIFIPGMGASWNTEAMVYNTVVADSDWKMTPFVNNYDGFFKALEKNGLKKNVDYFVWNYDWRRPLSEIVNKLDTYIDSKILTGDKVDIVGHSMGGVVGRIWLQGHLSDSRAGQVISAGSPQSGAIDTYALWNGAQIAGKDTVASTALNIMIQLQKKNNQTKLETLRQYAPGIQDLLPIFDFVKKSGKVVASNDLTFKNNYLGIANFGVNDIFSKYLSVVGYGEKTIEWLNLVERNKKDKALGYWPDGSINKLLFADGDGTVLPKSLIFSGDEYLSVNSNHGDIIQKSGKEILKKLGLNDKYLSDQDVVNNRDIVYFVGSPAYIKAVCKNNKNIVSDDLGFLILKDDDKCKISVVGTDTGTYHLVMGDIGKNNWHYAENEIKSGETVNLYEVNSWKQMIKRDLEILKLNNLIKELDKNNFKNVAKGIIKFRKETGEVVVSERIIDNLLEIATFNKYMHPLFGMLYGRAREEGHKLDEDRKNKYTFVEAINFQKEKELYAEMNECFEKEDYARAWANIEMAELFE